LRMITAQTPGTLSGLTATPVKVRGSCGHEWTPTTVKAAVIRAGGTTVKLNCPRCVSNRDWSKHKSKSRGHEILRAVVCNEPKDRHCTAKGCLGGPTKLSIYNPGATCGPCNHRMEKERAEKLADVEGRILAYLGRADRTPPWLAHELSLPVAEIKRLLFGLKAARKVEYGVMHASGQRFYRLAGGS
jgi:hypothetical protein